jgi:hypothetical protein
VARAHETFWEATVKVDRAKLRKLVRISLTCEPEDRTYKGEFENADGAPDREVEEWIAKELRSGNEWAWCSAHVVVHFGELKGEDWLGGCSYESKKDFMQPNGYYDSMIDEAVDALAKQIEAVCDGPDIWVHTNPSCLVCASDPPP